MNRNSGIAASVVSRISEKNWYCIRETTRSPIPNQPKTSEMKMKVNAIG